MRSKKIRIFITETEIEVYTSEGITIEDLDTAIQELQKVKSSREGELHAKIQKILEN